MKVTVISLTYNNSDVLPVAMMSFFKQKISSDIELEYIIADDGSAFFESEKINELIKNNRKIYSNVKVIINKKNLGTVRSFNNAIRIATGDIIIPLSADDEFYDENVIEKIASQFKDTSVNILTGLSLKLSSDGGKKLGEFPPRNRQYLFEEVNRNKLYNYMCTKTSLITGAATCYRKSYLEGAGFFDENYVLLEDLPFYIKALESNEHIVLLKSFTIKYSEGGVSTNKKNKNLLLEKDFDNLFYSLIERAKLTCGQKKYIYFKRFIAKDKKFTYDTAKKYPLQMILFISEQVKKKILGRI